MTGKLFFVDVDLGIRRTYAEFVQDVKAVRSAPACISAENHYIFLTHLVAAVAANRDISLLRDVRESSHFPIDNRQIDANSALSPASLWNHIAYSKSKVGLLTSGTTGPARHVWHNLDTLTRTLRCSTKHQTDVWGLTFSPASFAGLQVILQTLANTNTLVRLSELDEGQIHAAVRSEAITHISATPTWLRMFCGGGIEQPSIKQISIGGEIADELLFQLARTQFKNASIRNIYASTEFGSLLYSHGAEFTIPASLAEKVKVEHGELFVHRSLLSTTVQSSDVGEFYSTKDCVEVVASSPLTIRFLARLTDWINVAGNKVNPHEVEKLLMKLEGVRDALVYGQKNSVTGNLLCCKLVCSQDSRQTTASIRQSLKDVVDPHWIPRVIHFVDIIDRSLTGKKSRSANLPF